MTVIKANKDFNKFSYEDQIIILRYMYDTINATCYNSQLPTNTDIRICLISSNAAARYKKPDPYTLTESHPRIEFNERIICRNPFSHHDSWISFLEDIMAHEIVHLFNDVHGIQDVNNTFKDGRFTVYGYHNKHFKRTAIEHGQTCKRLDGRNGFSDTHLIAHFPLERWMIQ